MNEDTARAKGYTFQGCYSFIREDCEKRLAELKAKGYKCVIATVPADKLSRSPRSGYAVMAEEKYFIDRSIEELEKRITSAEYSKKVALAIYEKALRDIDEAVAKDQSNLTALKAKLEETK